MVRLPTYSMAGSKVAPPYGLLLAGQGADPAQELVAPSVVGGTGQQGSRLRLVVEILERHVDVSGVFGIHEPVFGAQHPVSGRSGDPLHVNPIVVRHPGLPAVAGAELPGSGAVGGPPELEDEVAAGHPVEPGLAVGVPVVEGHPRDGGAVEPAVQPAPGPALVRGGHNVDGVLAPPVDVVQSRAKRHDPPVLVQNGDHGPAVPIMRDSVAAGVGFLGPVHHDFDGLVPEQVQPGPDRDPDRAGLAPPFLPGAGPMAFASLFQRQSIGPCNGTGRGPDRIRPLLLRFENQISAPRSARRGSRGQNECDSPQPTWVPHDLSLPSDTTGLERTPTWGISISTRSPGWMGPTPEGVPVRITSPGSRVMAWLM